MTKPKKDQKDPAENIELDATIIVQEIHGPHRHAFYIGKQSESGPLTTANHPDVWDAIVGSIPKDKMDDPDVRFLILVLVPEDMEMSNLSHCFDEKVLEENPRFAMQIGKR